MSAVVAPANTSTASAATPSDVAVNAAAAAYK